MDLEKLIEEITKIVIERLEGDQSQKPSYINALPVVLLPVSYGSITWNEVCKIMNDIIIQDGIEIVPAADEMDRAYIEKVWNNVTFYSFSQFNTISPKLLSRASLLAVPLFSLYNLARVVNFTPLLLSERVILDALQKGLKVIIAEDEFHPEAPARKEASFDKGTASFKDQVNLYKKRLISWGAEFVSLQKLPGRIKSEFKKEESLKIIPFTGKREVLTNEDIILFSGSSEKIIKVSPGAIITPLAKDTARELGIEIKIVSSEW